MSTLVLLTSAAPHSLLPSQGLAAGLSLINSVLALTLDVDKSLLCCTALLLALQCLLLVLGVKLLLNKHLKLEIIS